MRTVKLWTMLNYISSDSLVFSIAITTMNISVSGNTAQFLDRTLDPAKCCPHMTISLYTSTDLNSNFQTRIPSPQYRVIQLAIVLCYCYFHASLKKANGGFYPVRCGMPSTPTDLYGSLAGPGYEGVKD